MLAIILILLIQPCEAQASRMLEAQSDVVEPVEGPLLDRWRERRGGDDDEPKRKTVIDRWDDRLDDNRDLRKQKNEGKAKASYKFWHIVMVSAAIIFVIVMASLVFGAAGIIQSLVAKLKSVFGR